MTPLWGSSSMTVQMPPGIPWPLYQGTIDAEIPWTPLEWCPRALLKRATLGWLSLEYLSFPMGTIGSYHSLGI